MLSKFSEVNKQLPKNCCFFLKIRSLDGHGTRYFKENVKVFPFDPLIFHVVLCLDISLSYWQWFLSILSFLYSGIIKLLR